jgi:hypothetical protein
MQHFKTLTALLSAVAICSGAMAQTRGQSPVVDSNPFNRVVVSEDDRSSAACETNFKWSGTATPNELDVGEKTDITYTLVNTGNVSTCSKLQIGLVKASQLGFGAWTCMVNKVPNTCSAVINKPTVPNAIFDIKQPLKPNDVVTLSTTRSLSIALPVSGNYNIGVVSGKDITAGKLISNVWIYPKKGKVSLTQKHIYGEGYTVSKRAEFEIKNYSKLFPLGSNLIVKFTPISNATLSIANGPYAGGFTLISSKKIANAIEWTFKPDSTQFKSFYIPFFSDFATDVNVSFQETGANSAGYKEKLIFDDTHHGISSEFKFSHYDVANKKAVFTGTTTFQNFSSKPIHSGFIGSGNTCTFKDPSQNNPGAQYKIIDLASGQSASGSYNSPFTQYPYQAAAFFKETRATQIEYSAPSVSTSTNPFESCIIGLFAIRYTNCAEPSASSNCSNIHKDEASQGTSPDTNGNGTPYDDAKAQIFKF